MPVGDLLIRDVPEDVIIAIDERARQMGVSRSEYLRRALARERTAPDAVTATDLQRFAYTFAELGDAEIMRRAWE
jgi:hypothetical protein